MDAKVEDHAHVFRHCFLNSLMFDTACRAFGTVENDGRAIEPSRLLLPLKTTQGLGLWVGLKCHWNLQCRTKYQRVPPVLDEFISGWCTIVRRWRAEKYMLQHLISQLHGWFHNPIVPGV